MCQSIYIYTRKFLDPRPESARNVSPQIRDNTSDHSLLACQVPPIWGIQGHTIVSTLSREPKELEQYRLNHRRDMPNTLSKVADQLVAVSIDHLGVLRSLINLAARLICSIRNTQHSTPLLKLLIPSLRTDQRVSKTMRNQEPRALARVSRVRVLDETRPLVRRVCQALRTRLVGAKGRGIAL
jgi:hypothetical protein